MHRHNARSRSSVMAFGALGALVGGCGSGDELDSGQIMQQVAGLSVPCASELRFAGSGTYENIATTVNNYWCEDPAGIITINERLGVLESLDILNEDDARAFKDVFHSMSPGLRKELEAAAPDEPVHAQVWFYVDRTDLNPTPLPDDGTDLGEEEFLKAELERRTRAGAEALVTRLRSVAGVEVASDLGADYLGLPIVEIRAPNNSLERVGDMREVWLMDAKDQLLPGGQADSSEYYFYVDGMNVLDPNDFVPSSWDGTGQKVAILEAFYPDSRNELPGLQSGGCVIPLEGQYKCHCHFGSPNAHPRVVMGSARGSYPPFGGTADEIITLAANHFDSLDRCKGTGFWGVNSFTSALNWAITNQGAKIVNYSEGTHANPNPKDGQNGADRYFDYLATVFPYPTITVITHNGGFSLPSATWVRNGIVVGGADATASTNRTDAIMDIGTQSLNPGGDNGWEMPHLVAPSVSIKAARDHNFDPASGLGGGTSCAAPQVAAIAAAMHEGNSAIQGWPTAVFAGLMVGANTDVDGNWPLSLTNFVDDKDGAGLVNGFATALALDASAKRNGNNTAAPNGHDYGGMSNQSPPAGTPAGTFYSETWFASVANNDTLRVAAILQAKPACGSPPNTDNCSSNPYPWFSLNIYNAGGGSVCTSDSNAQNYQYCTYKNMTGSPQTMHMKIRLAAWNGIFTTRYSIAWLSGGVD